MLSPIWCMKADVASQVIKFWASTDKPRAVPWVVKHRNNFFAKLPGRHRRAEACQKRLGLDARRPGVSVGARIADPGAADDLLRHDRLEADAQALLLGDAVGVLGHEPEHALGTGVAARHRRSVHTRATRSHQDTASR